MTVDPAVAPSDARPGHGMIPGSHERPDGPECRCGAAWDRWNARCTATVDTADRPSEHQRLAMVDVVIALLDEAHEEKATWREFAEAAVDAALAAAGWPNIKARQERDAVLEALAAALDREDYEHWTDMILQVRALRLSDEGSVDQFATLTRERDTLARLLEQSESLDVVALAKLCAGVTRVADDLASALSGSTRIRGTVEDGYRYVEGRLRALLDGTPSPASSGITLTVPDSPKMLRETLCIAQALVIRESLDQGRANADVGRLQRLIDECDRHRPLGPDGKHGDRHTPTCGCEDVTPSPASTTTDPTALAVDTVVTLDGSPQRWRVYRWWPFDRERPDGPICVALTCTGDEPDPTATGGQADSDKTQQAMGPMGRLWRDMSRVTIEPTPYERGPVYDARRSIEGPAAERAQHRAADPPGTGEDPGRG